MPLERARDYESNTEIPKRQVSPSTSTPEIPTAPILPAPSAIVAPSSEFPFAPVASTARKSVRPLHSHHLALRYTSHHLDHFTSGSSSSHSSSDHSLFRHSSLGHSLSGHTPPDTTDTDSSTPQRFIHPSLSRIPRCSKAYLCWRSTPLSTIYPPTTSESSVRDSFSKLFAGPSRKRCRSPTATVISPVHSVRALVPSRGDLFPPHKRFRDSISPEDSAEEEIDTNVLEDIEADATIVEVAIDRDVKARIDVGLGIEDEFKDEFDEERAGFSDRTRSLEQENLKVQALLCIERDWVDSLCRHMKLSHEEFRQFRRDRDDTRRRLRRLVSFVERHLGFRP
uniref:Uncharacterized protein n=1 Tax=Tanacetum cinerariifolium TaxID=118510 RepID=A0A6L2KW80_TANCI|nr:hypothetical protein [Tanacetum cinerariifolium]